MDLANEEELIPVIITLKNGDKHKFKMVIKDFVEIFRDVMNNRYIFTGAGIFKSEEIVSVVDAQSIQNSYSDNPFNWQEINEDTAKNLKEDVDYLVCDFNRRFHPSTYDFDLIYREKDKIINNSLCSLGLGELSKYYEFICEIKVPEIGK